MQGYTRQNQTDLRRLTQLKYSGEEKTNIIIADTDSLLYYNGLSRATPL